MSYIIEALKKAQKEKDSLSRERMDIPGSGKNHPLRRRIILSALLFCLVILLVFTFYSWLDHFDEKTEFASIKRNPEPVKKPEKDIGREDLYRKAGLLYKNRRYKEAKNLYEAVLGLDPGHVNTLNNLGVIYIRDKDYTGAEEKLKKAILLQPSYSEPYYNLACLYSITGDANRSLLYLNKAADLNREAVNWAREDSDLKNLWELPEFREMAEE